MRSRTTISCSRFVPLLAAAALAASCAGELRRPPTPVVAAPVRATPAPAATGNAALRAGIVRVRVTGQDWNWRAPWEKQQPWTRTVTGLVVPGRRILVAATAFGNHLLVEAQKLGSEERTVARVVLVDQEGPLALVEVDDPAFWDGLEPLPLAAQVPTEGTAAILRWQAGLLESYPGSVRQVRSGRHGLSQTNLLTLEVATGTDGLGESEVVFAQGQVAGLVTGRSGDTYVALAAPVLKQFLEGAQKGDWRGFARAGMAWQDLTNPALREELGLRPDERGIRVTRVAPNGSAASVLRPGDVLLGLDGATLDATGHYEHPLYGRMLFALLFTDGRRPGDTIVAKVLRGKERLELRMPLRRMLPDDDVVPPYLFGRGPDYVIAGGVVFQELTRPYLGAWGDWLRRAPPRLLIAVDRDAYAPDAPRRFVLLSTVLPDPANLGYQDLHDLLVEKVNGRAIGSLDDLRQALASPQGPFHVIELLPGQGARRVVLDVKEAQASAARLAAAYGVEHLDSASR
jgi:S1-C subfamily serine protease